MSAQSKSGHYFLHYSKFILLVGSVAILATVLGVGWYTQPDRYVRGYQPVQPIPFSHELHPGTLRIPCLYCHSGAQKSRVAGVPPVEKCMNCHKVTRTTSPPIKKLAAVYSAGTPMVWRRIYSLPDHVYFDHRPHVNSGILCQTCHGEVQ